ncbi:hypothetical protein ABPG72_009458 [Tetrahymena utriculariae]
MSIYQQKSSTNKADKSVQPPNINLNPLYQHAFQKKTSRIWEHWDQVNNRVTCKYYTKELNFNNFFTSNIWKHTEKNHSAKLKQDINDNKIQEDQIQKKGDSQTTE